MMSIQQNMNNTVAKCFPTNAVEAPSTRFFVTKIPKDCNEQMLQEYFTQFGEVADCHMPTRPCGLIHKGIAFVSMKDAETAQNVREIVGHSILGQKIVVDRAVQRNREMAAERKAAQRKHDAEQRGVNFAGYAKSAEFGPLSSSAVFTPAATNAAARVLIRDTPVELQVGQIHEYFSQMAPIARIELVNRVCIIHFENVSGQDEVLSKGPFYQVTPGVFVGVETWEEEIAEEASKISSEAINMGCGFVGGAMRMPALVSVGSNNRAAPY